MANDFFKKMASVFVDFEEAENKPAIEVAASKYPIPAKPKTAVLTATNQEPQTVAIPADPNTFVVDQMLMEKLCDELESVNLPGPDYQELKTAASDEDVVSIVSDPAKRFVLAYKTLKAAHPKLNKQHILDSIDVYVKHLEKCESDALTDIETKRKEVQSDVNRVAELEQLIARYQAEKTELQNKIHSLTAQCDNNEKSMKHHVAFLKGKLNEDKETINQVIKD